MSKEGNDEMTADAPTRFWYHLAANAPGGTANIKFSYEWRPSMHNAILLHNHRISTKISY